MTYRERPETEFARRLRMELRAVVAEHGAQQAGGEATGIAPTGLAGRRRAPRLGLVGACMAVLAALAFILSGGGKDTPTAFAVEAQPSGRVSVEIRSLEDPTGLEAALEDAGVAASVTYLENGTSCREPRFQAASDSRGLIAGPGSLIDPSLGGDGPIVFTIDRDEIGPGQTLVITASPRTDTLLGDAELKVVDGAAPPCEPVLTPATEKSKR